jgi:Protein of unknown function (DUF2934)
MLDHVLDQIRTRAYEIWLSEGCPCGRDNIHWVRAEAEFREKLVAARSLGGCKGGLHESPQ